MKRNGIVLPILIALSLTRCGNTTHQEAEATDSLSEGLRTPSEKMATDSIPNQNSRVTATSVAEVDFPLDGLVQYTTVDELVAGFGKENVVQRDDKVFLFPGTNREVEFSLFEGKFGMITAKAPTIWEAQNGLRLGMTIREVVELNKGKMAFHRKLGISGAAGGVLESNFQGFGFTVPDEIKSTGSDDWITYDELNETQKNKVKLGYIILYYEDQSIEEEEEPVINTPQEGDTTSQNQDAQ